MKFQLFLLFVTVSYADYCDPEKCPNLGPLLSCGVVLSETLVDGELQPKCGYFTSGLRARFNELRDFCQTISEDSINPMSTNGTGTGNLVSIANMEENQRVYFHIRNVTGTPPDFNVFPYGFPYIGLRKNCENCPHFWQDGSVFSFTNWNTNEPNNNDLFNCGQMYATMDGKWRNTFCSGNYAGYCEYFPKGRPEPLKVPNFPDSIPFGGCKQGWWRFGGFCYKEFGFSSQYWDPSQFKNFANANLSCKAEWEGATLARVPTSQHNAVVASLLGPLKAGYAPWIGISTFTYAEYNFAQINGDRLIYSNWIPNHPNHLQNGLEDCVELKWSTEISYYGVSRLGQWENKVCTEEKPYVCSHEESSQFPSYSYPKDYVYSEAGVECAEGWIPKEYGCYKIFLNEMTFNNANKFCEDEIKQRMPNAAKGSLATFWDEYEQNLAFSFFRDDTVPARDEIKLETSFKKGIWVGLTKQREGYFRDWRWVDFWPVEGTQWAIGRPEKRNSAVKKECAFLTKNNDVYDENCNEKMPFICKAAFGNNSYHWGSVGDALGEQLPCDEGWQSFGDHCFKGFTVSLFLLICCQKI